MEVYYYIILILLFVFVTYSKNADEIRKQHMINSRKC